MATVGDARVSSVGQSLETGEKSEKALIGLCFEHARVSTLNLN